MVNEVLVLCVISWAFAQVLKFLITSISKKQFKLEYLASGGGMPSSHSSFVCTCATATAWLTGLDSVPFAITVVFAFIVMYDAANVRKETGEQARILNYIMENWTAKRPEIFPKRLKELIGHTWMQVVVGGALGVLIGVIGCIIWP